MKKLLIKEFRSNESLVLGKDQMKMVMGGYLSCESYGTRYIGRFRTQLWSCNNGDKFVTGSWWTGGEWDILFDVEV